MLNHRKDNPSKMPALVKMIITQNRGVEMYCTSYLVTLPSKGGSLPSQNKTKSKLNIRTERTLQILQITVDTVVYEKRGSFIVSAWNQIAVYTEKEKDLNQGHPTSIFRKYLFGRRFEIENFRNICCKISCLPASPRIFEHLKQGIIAHF